MQPSQRTSLTLLEGVRGRDPESWRRLSELYGPVVYGWARRKGLGEHDAADVVQEVFQAVFSSIDRFRRERPSDRFRDWLFTITRRRLADHFRKRDGRPAATGGTDAQMRLHEVAEPADDADSVVTPREEAELLRRALTFVQAEFEERTWQACLRTAVEGRSPSDVAAELKMTVGAVYIARSRVLKRLRQALDGLV